MVQLVCRVTVVHFNSARVLFNSNHVLEVKEKRFNSLPGSYSKSIRIQPHASKNIPATKFHQRVISSSSPSTIVICIDGVELLYFTPEYFRKHSHITFTFDENNGTLHVDKVKPTGIIDELLRIRAFVA